MCVYIYIYIFMYIYIYIYIYIYVCLGRPRHFSTGPPHERAGGGLAQIMIAITINTSSYNNSYYY